MGLVRWIKSEANWVPSGGGESAQRTRKSEMQSDAAQHNQPVHVTAQSIGFDPEFLRKYSKANYDAISHICCTNGCWIQTLLDIEYRQYGILDTGTPEYWTRALLDTGTNGCRMQAQLDTDVFFSNIIDSGFWMQASAYTYTYFISAHHVVFATT